MDGASKLSPEKQILLEQRLRRASRKHAGGPVISKQPANKRDQLSFAQQQMWLIDQLNPGTPAYNLPIGYRIKGSLDAGALEASFNEIVKRHETLRSTFVLRDGHPAQVIHPEQKIKVAVTALDHLPADDRERKLQELASEESVRPFDLSRLPLLRVDLYKLGDSEHALIINIHHIVADGLSSSVLLNELNTFYRIFTGEPVPRPPDLAIQYSDFAVWQTQAAQNETQAQQLEYWKNRLGNQLPVAELPCDKARPALQSFKGSNVFFSIPPSLTENLVSLGQREGCTSFATMLAAFQVLLHRYSGAEDIVIGAPIADRSVKEVEPLIGNFVNMVALRCDLSGNPTFTELLRRSRETTLDAFSNKDVPFARVVEGLKFERDPGRNPIFQVVLQVMPGVEAKLGDLEVSSFQFDTKFAQFDLSLHLYAEGGGYRGQIEYCTDLFDAGTVEKLSRNLTTLLHGIVKNPQQRIAEIPILTEAERNEILFEWNRTGVEYPKQSTLHEWFESQVKKSPTARALTFGARHLTYDELNRRANQVAHHLKGLGVGPDTLVGLCVERSLEMVVGILGILKSGGSFLPIDPAAPKDRIAFMLEDASAPVLLTQAALASEITPTKSRVVCFDTHSALLDREPDTDLSRSSSPDNLAYVIYTSGSTGKPKGTLVTHYNVVRLMQATERWYRFDAQDVWTFFHSHAFDFSVWEMWGALLYGGRVVMVPYLVSRSPEDFYKLLVTERVTVLNQTPSAFRQLMQVEETLQAREALSLRWVIFGGEALEMHSLKPWFDRHGDQRPRLVNMYGITETTVHVTYRPLSAADLQSASVVGVPIPDLQIYILDAHQQPVPIGVTGEIYVGGAGVARGYLNREELTRQRFLPDTFRRLPAALLYRSGDLGRYLPNREIEYLGRIDDQVKIRGFRIELGEIEAVLGRHEAVRQCVVVAREDIPDDKRLVAYFETQVGLEPTASDLRAHLKKQLPEYMLPSAFVPMAALPMTPNGKIDRKSLPVPDSGSQVQGEFVAPRDEIEQALAQLWGKVLKTTRVGVQDNFFELGGHSLLAVRVMFEIEQLFGRRLPLATLLRAPTIGNLADELRKEGTSATQKIPPRRLDEAIPLSYAQEQIWLHAQLAAELPLYNESLTIRYTGPLNVVALERSFNEILRRHEAWRTSITTVAGQPAQAVQPEITISLPVMDLRSLPNEQREAKALSMATEDARTPLDLAQPPLFRARLIRIDDQEHRLYMTLSHTIFDGVAIFQVFLPELVTLYEAFSEGKPSPLPELPIQYPDYACWQHRCLTGKALSDDTAYWRRQLGRDLPAVYLPVDRPRTGPQSFRGSTYTFRLDSRLTKAIRALSQEEGASMFHVLLAGFAALLRHYSGEEVIPIGSITAGRNLPETQSLLGCFLNTVVLAVDFSGDPTFRDLIDRARKVTIEALEHDSLPFGHLVKELRVRRDPSHNPLFQALITLDPPLPELNPAWRLNKTNLETSVTKYDFHLELDERSDSILAILYYSTDLFDLETIKRMAGHWQTLLEGAAGDSGLRVSELPLLSKAEQRELVARNDTRRDYPRDRCIHHLFTAQCEHTPDAVAITWGKEHLTYRQLQQRSNRLARYLQRLGVSQEAPVGLCVERSLDMVVGLLGILKAGCAYLPLDPGYPTDRLAFMLEDSGIAVLLTQQKLLSKLPQNRARQICLDTDWQKIAVESAADPSSPIGPEDPAYVIYTSGSTGKPKGVIGTHRAAINRFSWMWQTYPFRPGEVCCQKTSLSFVDSVWEIFGPLLKGAPIVIIPDEVVRDVDLLVESLAANHVTRIVLVPSLLRAILSNSSSLQEKLPELKLWVSSGEALPPDLAQRFLDRMPGHMLLNLYGSTEVAADATCYQVGSNGTTPSVPIGQPIANTRIYLLDARRRPVPVNVAGEIYIGGDAVARGYLNRPEMTAEKFVPDPFTNQPGARLFKTGDRGRYHADGNIECLGRFDDQVKIRGFRIEPGEIEAVLGRHEAVRQCVVVVREDTPGDKRLVAYFEAQPGLKPAVSDLRAHLREQLPEFMLPSAFVALESLPVTPNGKIDRKSLPSPDGASQIEGTFVAPQDETEQALAQLWAKVLKTTHVGVHDNFFDLGGHSLLAVRIMFEIEKLFGKRLPLATLLQAPTIANLADVLRKENWKPNWSSLVAIQPGGSKPPLFLMHSHGGNVLEYYPLASYLERDQPVYALQARGLDGRFTQNQSIETMVTLYLEEVRSLQPVGPYSLGGFCFGGLLALEAAHQLTASGEEVALIVLIQTMNPALARFKPGTTVFQQWCYRATKRIDLERDNLSYRGARYIYERCVDVADIARARISIALDQTIRNGRHRRTRPSLRYVLESLRIEHEKARKKYVLRPYHGDVVVFRASKTLSGLMIDQSLGWKDVVQGHLDVCEIPGHQQNMLSEPNVSRLAEEFSARLPVAQDSVGSSNLIPT